MPYKNKEQRKAHDREYYQKNKLKRLVYGKEYRIKNRDKLSKQRKEYYLKNKNYLLAKKHEYYQKNIVKEKARTYAYKREKLKTNPEFKAKELIRNLILNRLRRFIKGKEERHICKYLGYPIRQLKEHIEKQFQQGVTSTHRLKSGACRLTRRHARSDYRKI